MCLFEHLVAFIYFSWQNYLANASLLCLGFFVGFFLVCLVGGFVVVFVWLVLLWGCVLGVLFVCCLNLFCFANFFCLMLIFGVLLLLFGVFLVCFGF